MPDIFMTAHRAFFDSSKVIAMMDKKERAALSKFGAFVRTRARSSIRKSKKSALPGQPPKSHSGELKRIYFAWDSQTKSVVVGPVPFAGKRGTAVAPKLLEMGGISTFTERGRRRTAKYKGNPFMNPAMQAELPKFVHLFKG